MKQQCVKILFGINDIEKQMNGIIKEMNKDGWSLVNVTNHYSRQSNWCLLFEKTMKK